MPTANRNPFTGLLLCLITVALLAFPRGVRGHVLGVARTTHSNSADRLVLAVDCVDNLCGLTALAISTR